jgi:hypothetical protein
MVTPAAKGVAVAHVRSVFELNERRACRIIGCVPAGRRAAPLGLRHPGRCM